MRRCVQRNRCWEGAVLASAWLPVCSPAVLPAASHLCSPEMSLMSDNMPCGWSRDEQQTAGFTCTAHNHGMTQLLQLPELSRRCT